MTSNKKVIPHPQSLPLQTGRPSEIPCMTGARYCTPCTPPRAAASPPPSDTEPGPPVSSLGTSCPGGGRRRGKPARVPPEPVRRPPKSPFPSFDRERSGSPPPSRHPPQGRGNRPGRGPVRAFTSGADNGAGIIFFLYIREKNIKKKEKSQTARSGADSTGRSPDGGKPRCPHRPTPSPSRPGERGGAARALRRARGGGDGTGPGGLRRRSLPLSRRWERAGAAGCRGGC